MIERVARPQGNRSRRGDMGALLGNRWPRRLETAVGTLRALEEWLYEEKGIGRATLRPLLEALDGELRRDRLE